MILYSMFYDRFLVRSFSQIPSSFYVEEGAKKKFETRKINEDRDHSQIPGFFLMTSAQHRLCFPVKN